MPEPGVDLPVGLLVVRPLEFAAWRMQARQVGWRDLGFVVEVGTPQGTLWVVREPCRWSWGRFVPPPWSARCYGCGFPCSRWWRRTPRVVYFDGLRGQFALCTRCWERGDLTSRLTAHAYVTLVAQQAVGRWPQVRAAIEREYTDGMLDASGEERAR